MTRLFQEILLLQIYDIYNFIIYSTSYFIYVFFIINNHTYADTLQCNKQNSYNLTVVKVIHLRYDSIILNVFILTYHLPV